MLWEPHFFQHIIDTEIQHFNTIIDKDVYIITINLPDIYHIIHVECSSLEMTTAHVEWEPHTEWNHSGYPKCVIHFLESYIM